MFIKYVGVTILTAYKNLSVSHLQCHARGVNKNFLTEMRNVNTHLMIYVLFVKDYNSIYGCFVVSVGFYIELSLSNR